MAYLSRIWLNPWRRQTRRFLRDPQSLHAAVLGGLANQPVAERVLWRLDGAGERVITEPPRDDSQAEAGGTHRFALYVLTRSSPSWEHLVEQAGWPAAESDDAQYAVRDYMPLLERLDVDDHYSFRLTANPTKSIRETRPGNDRRPRGKRVAHVTARQQLGWLVEKSEQCGFEIPTSTATPPTDEPALDVRLADRNTQRFSKGGSADRRVTVSYASFEGHLIIRDLDKIRSALLDGIGPAKAYGCGLLTLAPLTG